MAGTGSTPFGTGVQRFTEPRARILRLDFLMLFGTLGLIAFSLVTLDTATLDRQIAALKAQAKTATRQLALVRREASGLVRPADGLAGDRPLLASLEQRTGELEQEAQWLLARIAAAEEELARSEVRAPVSGRVVALGVHGPDAPIAPGTTLIEIATADGALLERLLAPVLRGLAGHRTPAVQVAEPRE